MDTHTVEFPSCPHPQLCNSVQSPSAVSQCPICPLIGLLSRLEELIVWTSSELASCTDNTHTVEFRSCPHFKFCNSAPSPSAVCYVPLIGSNEQIVQLTPWISRHLLSTDYQCLENQFHPKSNICHMYHNSVESQSAACHKCPL